MSKALTKILQRICFIICLCPLLTFNVQAQKMSVPIRIQAATFLKVFKYDNQLKGKNPIRLLIVYNKKSSVEKEQFINAFKKTSVIVSATRLNQLQNNLKNIDVVYFMPGLISSVSICKNKKKLSISGVAKYAQEGKISIALDLFNDKPRLFINLASLKNEGHTVSASLLKISKVFR